MKFHLGALAAISAAALCSCQNSAAPAAVEESPAIDPISIVEDVPTAQAFLKDPIPDADLQRIANAGVNAPSAMNKQPWHFAIVSNAELIAQMVEDQRSGMKFPPRPEGMPNGGPQGGPMGGPGAGAPGDRPMPPTGNGPRSGLGDSPAVIIISCTPGSEFDAGLACESMNDMANVLGYGTKIATSVTMLFNGDKKAEYYEKLQIPEGQSIVGAILVGKVNTEAYDAVSSATPRNAMDQVVTFIK